jgi:hypothetical protein
VAKGEGYEVTILSRDEVVTYPKVGKEARQIIVTYVAAGLPPASIFIPKEAYSPETEKKALKADIERRLKAKPETLRV